MLPIAAASPSRIVHGPYRLHLAQIVSRPAQPPTKINILVVKKILLVETGDFSESG